MEMDIPDQVSLEDSVLAELLLTKQCAYWGRRFSTSHGGHAFWVSLRRKTLAAKTVFAWRLNAQSRLSWIRYILGGLPTSRGSFRRGRY